MMPDTFSDICEPRIARGDRFLVIIFGDCEASPFSPGLPAQFSRCLTDNYRAKLSVQSSV